MGPVPGDDAGPRPRREVKPRQRWFPDEPLEDVWLPPAPPSPRKRARAGAELLEAINATAARLKVECTTSSVTADVDGWEVTVFPNRNGRGGQTLKFVDPIDDEKILSHRRLSEKLVGDDEELGGGERLQFIGGKMLVRGKKQKQDADRKQSTVDASTSSQTTTMPAKGSSSEPGVSSRGRRSPPGLPLVERYRQQLDGRPIVLIGDSIAEELGHHLLHAEGFRRDEVIVIAKSGAVPAYINAHLVRWLAADKENITRLRGAGLVIVCAGKNLCRTTPALIGSEVNEYLAKPLKKLVPHAGSSQLPVLLVEPLTREGLDDITRENLTRESAQSSSNSEAHGSRGGSSPVGEDSGGENGGSMSTSRVTPPCRRHGRSAGAHSITEQTHLDLARTAGANGFIFFAVSDPPRLTHSDFRDNLHLHDAAYHRMADELLQCWGEHDGHVAPGSARSDPCVAGEQSTEPNGAEEPAVPVVPLGSSAIGLAETLGSTSATSWRTPWLGEVPAAHLLAPSPLPAASVLYADLASPAAAAAVASAAVSPVPGDVSPTVSAAQLASSTEHLDESELMRLPREDLVSRILQLQSTIRALQ